ncbi:MAG: rane protein [Chloroflexi bacterium]|nr:rane protein [Chloroflexota bacterium]
MNGLDRLALRINDLCGSMVTFLIVAAYEVIWVTFVGIGLFKFDSLPNLPLLLVILNLPQLPLMFALMVSGNMLSRHSELRAEADFQVNQKAEAQIEKLLEINQFQTEQILSIMKRLEGSKAEPVISA